MFRGAQGALYGRNAVGGAINVVSQRPGPSPEGFVQGRIANNERYEIQAAANITLAENLWARLGVLYLDQDEGFFYSTGRDEHIDAESSEIFRAQLRYENGPFDVNLLAEHGFDRLPGLTFQFRSVPNATYPQGILQDKYNYSWNFPSVGKQQVNTLEMIWTYELPFGELSSASGYRERRSTHLFEGDGMNPEYLGEIIAQGLVSPAAIARLDPNRGGANIDFARIYFQDLHLSGSAGRFDWLAGVEYYNLQDKFFGYLFNTPAGPSRSPGTIAPGRASTESIAAYGSVEYAITETLHGAVELRYTRDDKAYRNRRLDLATGAVAGQGFSVDAADTSDNLSYTASLTWDFAPDWMAYGKIGTAYRAGGFNASLGDPRQPVPVPAEYGNETSRTHEVGAKGNLGRNAYVAAAAYVTDVSNLIIQTDNGCNVTNADCPVGPTNFLRNAGKARVWGIELEGTARADLAGGSARLSLGISRQGGEVVSGPDEGRRPPQFPEWVVAANLNYQRAIFSDLEGFVNLQVSGRWGGVQEIAQTPPLHDYQLIDARAGVRRGPWEFALFANNLTDTSFITFENPTSFRWNQPRTYGAELSYRW